MTLSHASVLDRVAEMIVESGICGYLSKIHLGRVFKKENNFERIENQRKKCFGWCSLSGFPKYFLIATHQKLFKRLIVSRIRSNIVG